MGLISRVSSRTYRHSRLLSTMSQNDVGDWYNGIPRIFRAVFTAMVLGPLVLRFKLVDPALLLADYEKVFYSFNIWRPVTACLLSGVNFHWAINLYIFYNYGKALSEGTFENRPADEAFMYTVLMVACNVVGWMFGRPVFYYIVINAVIYVWAMCNREVQAKFYFGIQMKAAYLPWAMAAFGFLLQEDVSGFLGIVAGHVYFFLKYKWPYDFGGRDFLATPKLYEDLFPATRRMAGRNVEFRQPARAEGQARGGATGHNWGSGHRLGD